MSDPAPLHLEIHDVAFGGKVVARHEGKVYFVPFTIPGEKVTARVLRQKKNFGEAELLSVETPSPDRTEAPCPYFGRCGGSGAWKMCRCARSSARPIPTVIAIASACIPPAG